MPTPEFAALAGVDKGDVLPVRYDPADHSRVEVDFRSFRADYERGVAALDDERLRAAERDFDQD